MRYKVIVCDLDGTLLDSDHNLQKHTREQISRVTNLGCKVILATGRHYIDVRYIAKELGLDSCVIGSNGTNVYSSDGDNLVNHKLDSVAVETVFNFNFPESVHLNIYQGKEWLVLKENKELLNFHKQSGLKYRVISSIYHLEMQLVNKFYLYSTNKEDLELCEIQLKKELGDLADVFFSFHAVIEVMPKGVSKGLALEELMKKNNISKEEVIAFGDGLNDLEMLKWAGKGLIMSNADENLKKSLPNLEIIGSNNENGVANYLEYNIK